MTLLIYTFISIFNFSSQNGEQSSSLSKKIARKCIDFFPNTKDASEEEKTEMVESCQFLIRKLAHFSIYMCVGLFIMTFVSTYNIESKLKFFISIFIGFLYAVSDEIHQGFIPERSPSFFDVIIDTFGTLSGIIIIQIFFLIHKFISKRVKG